MSDSNEQRDAAQREGGSTQDGTEGNVEATPAAERKAQDLSVDLASVEGTGSGGRVTVSDVENAQRQTASTAESAETRQSDLSRQDPQPPSLDDIQRQYVVLKATLAGPKDGHVPLTFFREDGVEEPITANTFPDNPTNFFAPKPLRADLPADRVPVTWILPRPQRLLPKHLRGTNQPCRREDCFPARIVLDNG